MNKARVTTLIPAFNEAESITKTIFSLKKIKEINQIIVIDDGSSDNTGELAENTGVQVISLAINKGKGNALNIGAKFIKEDIVALVDADLKNTAIEITKLIEPVINGKSDMAIAVFPPASTKGGFGLVKKAASLGLKILTKKDFKAPLSGQRVMTRQVFENLLPLASGFGVEVGMTVDAIAKGYKIIEVDTNMAHAETGRNWVGFLHRGTQLKDVFMTLTIKGWR
ncbi:MAG: hypothetical protein PWQ67_1530 [Clostridia bacterium]|jgi:glycosyltransferase involved in cell wall biosynthesis|nr:hypothetical protein [Clostridia bacterium]MDN5323076.1 hypothetical protein [Clostridia bacterium]